jgi:diguanylate cyclase (GGDEF)-like protein
MLDVDYFKKVNDSYGHHAGDLVLVEISRVLSNCVRQYDAVGRYGGEEFLVVLPGCKADSAADRAEQLRAAVAASRTAAGDKSLAVTVSVGLACAEEPEAAQAQILLSAADEALYAAKSAGRNCVSVAPRADELIVSGDGGR